ncbi:hypothetical protein CBFG_02923 [Clostridiales bacterium 1_7_47FAA]|uniref:Zinc ribbon domain-containing protein n=1 Tax=Enterocloster hominis (ex Hitch et al. 2024) TaxID=1917870 RepID=A0ABV1D5W6_9FIRM|nr:hypothetical protein CBFG_02923 [Clostridiales bacterium 1_7_47FAA]
MITPATMVVNLAHKATGWNPIICSHEELIEVVKKIFIEGQSVEFLDKVKQVSKGGFWKEFLLATPDERYELYIESAAYSKGRLVTIRDKDEKKIYEKDYLLLKKFAEAVTEECEKELRNPTTVFDRKIEVNFGHSQAGNDMQVCFCPECGTGCEVDDIFCRECGTLLKEVEKTE